MPALSARRSSLCLFCVSSAARPWPRPQHLLPYVQVAHRTGRAQKNTEPFSLDGKFSNGMFNTIKTFGSERDRSVHFEAIRTELEILRKEFVEPEFLESLSITRETFDKEWLSFQRIVSVWIKTASAELRMLTSGPGRRRNKRLSTRLRYLFYAQAWGGRFTQAELDNQKAVADLRFPAEWYPATREICRTVHMHVGPTNSGKTYRALKRLEEAKSGIYLGPLRLLAHEVYTRLNAKGKPCALITGEEQRLPDSEHEMWSCTVEMAPLNTRMDVAVIDEIQMINHPDRGWAWTQAFLGLQAKELHLCGEARTVPLIRELCALTGDKIHVHEYERLSPLKVANASLGGNMYRLEKGDCIVCFSVLGIHAMRREIERRTNKKCAIVYGSLPPETRAQQARLFNDPDNDFDFLVASDAIGMGLNLSIKRVIFEAVDKNNGTKEVPLEIAEIKQIAGRAGRFKTAHQAINQDKAEKSDSETDVDSVIGLDDTPQIKPENKAIGYATTMWPKDFNRLKRGMQREADIIKTAGLFPPSLIIERFANYFPPGTPFSYVMLRLHEISNTHPRFQLCALKDQLAIADAIHLVKNLSTQDRIMLCSAPAKMKDSGERIFLQELAFCIAEGKSGDLLDISNLPLEILDMPPSNTRKYLQGLEQLHKMLVLYLWLTYRFPNVFTSRKLASHVTKLVQEKIEMTLSRSSFTATRIKDMQKRQEAIQDVAQLDKGKEEASSEIGASTLIVVAAAAAANDTPQTVRDVL